MKHILFAAAFLTIALHAQAQIQIVDPATFTVLAEPDDTNFEFYSRKTGTNVRASYTAVRKRMLPGVGGVVGYTPSSTGNAQARRGLITKNAAGDIYYVDGFGVSMKLSSATGTVYPVYTDDHEAAAACVSTYEVGAANPYGLPKGTIRKRVFGTVSNCN